MKTRAGVNPPCPRVTHGMGTRGLGRPGTAEGPGGMYGEEVCTPALHDATLLPSEAPPHRPSDLPLLAPGMRGIWWDSGA